MKGQHFLGSMNKIEKAYNTLSRAGIYGSIKSITKSMKYTNELDKLIFHSKTLTDISEKTEFNINNRFAVGIGRSEATHPRIHFSKFETRSGSSISHTGEYLAAIGPGSVVHIEGDFSMGDSYINSHSRIVCGDNITIGDHVAIAWNFEILDDDLHQITIDGERRPQTRPIEIQDDVWIGHDVSVHKGVTISKGSVVSSDSVVLSDVPPCSLVAGCPAEVVRENVDWD